LLSHLDQNPDESLGDYMPDLQERINASSFLLKSKGALTLSGEFSTAYASELLLEVLELIRSEILTFSTQKLPVPDTSKLNSEVVAGESLPAWERLSNGTLRPSELVEHKKQPVLRSFSDPDVLLKGILVLEKLVSYLFVGNQQRLTTLESTFIQIMVNSLTKYDLASYRQQVTQQFEDTKAKKLMAEVIAELLQDPKIIAKIEQVKYLNRKEHKAEREKAHALLKEQQQVNNLATLNSRTKKHLFLNRKD
jgi:hypothetical protein